MKTKLIIIIASMLLLSSGSKLLAQTTGVTKDTPTKATEIACTPELTPLARVWIQAYNSTAPAQQVSVKEVTREDFLAQPDAGIGLMRAGAVTNSAPSPAWKMVVARNILLPIFNQENPFRTEIVNRGVSSASLANALKENGESNWGSLLGSAQDAPLKLYIQEGEEVRAQFERFLNEEGISFASIGTRSAQDIIRRVQEDPLAIGFCNAAFVQGTGETGLQPGLFLLPIDKNGNGQIDPVENIYEDFAALQRGVWVGKYPRALCENIYVVGSALPIDDASQDFLKWVMAEGQQYVNSQGYAGILSIERNANLAQLPPAELMDAAPQRTASLPLILSAILILGIAAGIGLRAFMRTASPKKEALAGVYAPSQNPLDEKAIQVLEGLYYDSSHTWAFREKNGWVSVGLDDFMQHLVGPITRIQMKNAGETVKKGEVLFSLIQSGKQLSIYAPFSGTIRKQNEMLSRNAAAVNTSPYSEGWVYQIEPSHWLKDAPLLKAAEKFRNTLSDEFSRVKDVLAASLKPGSLENAYVHLQDGGVLKDGVLSELSPEVWADFQSHFLDQRN